MRIKFKFDVFAIIIISFPYCKSWRNICVRYNFWKAPTIITYAVVVGRACVYGGKKYTYLNWWSIRMYLSVTVRHSCVFVCCLYVNRTYSNVFECISMLPVSYSLYSWSVVVTIFVEVESYSPIGFRLLKSTIKIK